MKSRGGSRVRVRICTRGFESSYEGRFESSAVLKTASPRLRALSPLSRDERCSHVVVLTLCSDT